MDFFSIVISLVSFELQIKFWSQIKEEDEAKTPIVGKPKTDLFKTRGRSVFAI
jgi:hypothetical protein